MNEEKAAWQEMSQEERKRANVQRVLDCHNEECGTDFEVVGRSVHLCPELKHPGKDWNWVCRDSVSGVEGAVEVKNLTDPAMERTSHFILEEVCREVCDIVGCKVAGRFHLTCYMGEEPIELRRRERTRFVECLAGIVRRTAPCLDLGTSCDLTGTLRQSFPELPRKWRFALLKLGAEGTAVSATPVGGRFAPTQEFWGDDFAEFKKDVKKANKQLGVARKKGILDTFLILADEGWMAPDGEAVAWGVGQIEPRDRCNIKWVYFRVGDIVYEIPN